MKNIWKIFVTDIKGLVKHPFAMIIAIGLCILPSLYAWFNIYSNWDPYGNTSNIRIAIVSEDEGFTEDDGTYVNMGDEVVEEMKAKTTIAWTVVDSAKEATDGVQSGKYYAAVVISEDFTSTMYHALETDFDANPTITYYENEKKNAVATKITDSAVSSLKQSTNEKFIEVITSFVFEKTNTLAADLEEDDSMETLEGKLRELNTNLTSYSNLVTTFIESNDSLSDAVDDAGEEVPKISSSIQNGANSISKANSNLQGTQTAMNEFSGNVTATLTTIETSLNTIAQDISNASLAEDAQATAESATQAATDTAELIKQLNELKKTLTETAEGSQEAEEAKNALESVLETLGTLTEGAEDVQGKLEDLIGDSGTGTNKEEIQSEVGSLVAEGVTTVTDSMKNSLNSCSQSVANMKNLYTNNLVPEMNNVVNSMSQVLNNVTNILNGLSNTVGDMDVIFDGIETTISGTNSSLEQIKDVIDNVNGKIENLLGKLENAEEDEKVQILLEVMQGDPESYGEFFAAPVTITTEEVYPIENYGSAMTPFYSVLAIWVGMTILVSIIKVKAEPKDLINPKSYQLFFGRYLLFFLLSQIQTAIIVLGDIYLLHCQILYPGLFWFAAALTSLTFSLLIYSLTISFGDIGKALAVVVMVIQIAGSSGTFPIELLPSVYQNIYIFFPFPYAINAIRETIGGMYGDTYVTSLSELLIFSAVALIIGLVIRIPFVGINHFMEERMEDTKMM
ncbi:MAG: YhgE/Pip family protein [Roseburia sp.]